MAKIVTRPPAEEVGLQKATERLTEILGKHTKGAIGKGPGSIAAPKDFDEAAAAVDLAMTLALRAITDLQHENALQHLELQMVAERLDRSLEMFEKFINLGFDEALDKATDELFQVAEASGFAETNADGELGFDPRVTFTKADLKPLVLSVVEAWLEQRIKEL